MENTIYRINDFDGKHTLEFYVCTAVGPEPETKFKDLWVQIFNDEGFQIDTSLDDEQLESLIEYLRMAQRHIQIFNKKM